MADAGETRPWGSFEILYMEDNLKIKRIRVKPGMRLSLQSHKHRHEHWTVMTGSALVTRGNQQIDLDEHQMIHIPVGEKHRVKNPGGKELVIIEIQTGTYLGEDDIQRYEDDFDRL